MKTEYGHYIRKLDNFSVNFNSLNLKKSHEFELNLIDSSSGECIVIEDRGNYSILPISAAFMAKYARNVSYKAHDLADEGDLLKLEMDLIDSLE